MENQKNVDEQDYTTNVGDKRSIPKQNDKQNRVAFDRGNQVPVHSAQQNLIRGAHVQNFISINMKYLRKNKQTHTPLISKLLNP